MPYWVAIHRDSCFCFFLHTNRRPRLPRSTSRPTSDFRNMFVNKWGRKRFEQSFFTVRHIKVEYYELSASGFSWNNFWKARRGYENITQWYVTAVRGISHFDQHVVFEKCLQINGTQEVRKFSFVSFTDRIPSHITSLRAPPVQYSSINPYVYILFTSTIHIMLTNHTVPYSKRTDHSVPYNIVPCYTAHRITPEWPQKIVHNIQISQTVHLPQHARNRLFTTNRLEE